MVVRIAVLLVALVCSRTVFAESPQEIHLRYAFDFPVTSMTSSDGETIEYYTRDAGEFERSLLPEAFEITRDLFKTRRVVRKPMAIEQDTDSNSDAPRHFDAPIHFDAPLRVVAQSYLR